MVSSVLKGQLQVGDTCPDFSIPICANGSGDFELYNTANGSENGGNYKVVLISIFATWSSPDQSAAPITETLYQEYAEQGLITIGNGFDYSPNGPYSCESWASSFGITYPILDGDADGTIWSLFGQGYLPHNVVLDHNMDVIYTDAGFNQTAIINAIEEALADLPSGPDPCGWAPGDLDASGNTDILDIGIMIKSLNGLIDLEECAEEASDMNADGVVNVMDLLNLVTTILIE